MNKTESPIQLQVPGPGVHVPALDGLRGLAILLVMVGHFILYGGMEPTLFIDRQLSKIGLTGWIGVDLFFVLSGFLITGILVDTKESSYFFRTFYLRRVLRIFPLYYGFLIFCFWVWPRLVSISADYQSILWEQGWYWSYLTNIAIARNGWGAFHAFGHFWSLAVEEQFYLVWPVVIYLLPRQSLRALCLLILFGSFVLRVGLGVAGYPLAAYLLMPARMDTLALGALLAIAVRERNADHLQWTRAAWLVTGGAGGVLFVYFLWKGRLAYGDWPVYTIGFSVIALFFGAILLIALATPPETRLGRFFTSSPLRFLGRYSYALYVFHHPISIYLPDYGFSVQTFPTWLGSQLPGLLLFSVVAFLLSIALALVSWYLVEARFLALKRFLGYAPENPSTKIDIRFC